MVTSRQMGSFRGRIINFVFQTQLVTDLGKTIVTALLSFLPPLLLIPCTRSHSPGKVWPDKQLIQDHCGVGSLSGGRGGQLCMGTPYSNLALGCPSAHLTLHGFSPLSCAKYKLLHVMLYLRGANLWHEDGNLLKLNPNVIQ